MSSDHPEIVMSKQLMVTDNWSTKYRPRRLSDFIGQPKVVQMLEQRFAKHQVPRTILISGETGMGKTTLARIIATTINDGIPSEKNIDVNEVNAGDQGGIDSIRDMRKLATMMPQQSNFRVFIIDEVHKLTSSALGALLKILEEPPARVVWILATNHPDTLPRELIGRCQHMRLDLCDQRALMPYLAKIGKAENVFQPPQQYRDIYAWVAQAAGGQPRLAVQFFESIAYTYQPGMDPKEALNAALDNIGMTPDVTACAILAGVYLRRPDHVVAALTDKIDADTVIKNTVWLNQSLLNYRLKITGYQPPAFRRLMQSIGNAVPSAQRVLEVHKILAELADNTGYSTTSKTAKMVATLGVASLASAGAPKI